MPDGFAGYEFEGFQITEDGATFTFNGDPVVNVGPLTRRVLIVLLRKSKKTVTRREFEQHVWPDTQVVRGALDQHIRILRNVIDSRLHLVGSSIDVIPGVGFMFTLEVIPPSSKPLGPTALGTKQPGHNLPSEMDQESILAARSRILREHLDNSFCVDYYSDSLSLRPYRFRIDRSAVRLAAGTQPKWRGLSIALGHADEVCTLVEDAKDISAYSLRGIEGPLAILRSTKLNIWDNPIYRLTSIQIDHKLRADFALDRFMRWRCREGLLAEELLYGLWKADFDSRVLLKHAPKYLPLRDQLLRPDMLLSLDSRICEGGPNTVFAIARGAPHNDFVIPLETRSVGVGLNQGQLTTIPTGVHQPMISPLAEVRISCSIFRELFEEVFGGDEIEGDIRHYSPDWYFEASEPLAWLRSTGRYVLELIGFGINLLVGGYELCALLAVEDETFYDKFFRKMKTNWEAEPFAGPGALSIERFPCVSTRDTRQLAEVLSATKWNSECLFAFCEALLRLSKLAPERVSLPDLQID